MGSNLLKWYSDRMAIQKRKDYCWNYKKDKAFLSNTHIYYSKGFLRRKGGNYILNIFSEDYAQMLHAEPVLNYRPDILCMGSTEEKQKFFIKGRKVKANGTDTF